MFSGRAIEMKPHKDLRNSERYPNSFAAYILRKPERYPNNFLKQEGETKGNSMANSEKYPNQKQLWGREEATTDSQLIVLYSIIIHYVLYSAGKTRIIPRLFREISQQQPPQRKAQNDLF